MLRKLLYIIAIRQATFVLPVSSVIITAPQSVSRAQFTMQPARAPASLAHALNPSVSKQRGATERRHSELKKTKNTPAAESRDG